VPPPLSKLSAADQMWVDPARARSMASHPAGKHRQDQQRGYEQLLKAITSPPPRPAWEERIEELTADFAAGLIEAFREALT